MDKVNGSGNQSLPIWDRQKSHRGHYSSVDKALQAHRQRKAERHEQIEQRLNMVRNIQDQFFPTAGVAERPQMMEDTFQTQTLNNAQNPVDMAKLNGEMIQPQVKAFTPMEMDELYSEASMGSVADNALGVVQKEISNPEEVPNDEVPKGSYVDYTV